MDQAAHELEALPFPVAYPLALSQERQLSPGERLDNLIFASYQAVRTTSLLLLADYLAQDAIVPALAGPIRGLRLPHWGEWVKLTNELALFWVGRSKPQPDRSSFFPLLASGWLEVARPSSTQRKAWRALLEGLPGISGPASSAIDALQRTRNDRAHRTPTRELNQGREVSLLARLAPLVSSVIEKLFPPGEFSLLRRVDDHTVLTLHGPHLDLSFSPVRAAPEWDDSFSQGTNVVAVSGTGLVPVFPLFVPLDPETGEHEAGGGGLVEPIALLDGASDRKVVLLGVRGYRETKELVRPLLEALSRKQVDLALDRKDVTRWSLVDWTETQARETLTSLRGRKYFPECYLERAGVDDRIFEVLDRPGRGLLLLGEAGSGKSSFCARLVERVLNAAEMLECDDQVESSVAKRDKRDNDEVASHLAGRGWRDVVIFLSGGVDYRGSGGLTGRQLLCEAVLRKAGVRPAAVSDLADLAARLAETAGQDSSTERRVWFVLDAINEAERFPEILAALDDFLPAIERYPWLRVVATARGGAFRALASRHERRLAHGPGVLGNARFLASFADEQGELRPWLEFRPFDPEREGPDAYALRQQRLSRRASAIAWESLTPTIRRLLSSPLHLHVFHETFKDESRVSDEFDEGKLFRGYLDHLKHELPGLGSTLLRLGQVMFERRRPDLPLEIADQWLADWRVGSDGVGATSRLDPLEELVAASLLLRPAEEGFGVDRRLVSFAFVHQRLAEQVLLAHLEREIKAVARPDGLPDAAELLSWARRAAGEVEGALPFAELTNVLMELTRRLVIAGCGDRLGRILELEHEPTRTQIIGTGIRTLAETWDRAPSGHEPGRLFLEALREGALASPGHGRRFDESTWRLHRELVGLSKTGVALALAEARHQVLSSVLVTAPTGDDYRDLSLLLNDLGNLARIEGRTDAAHAFFTSSVQLMRRLVTEFAHEPAAARFLPAALNRLAEHALANEQTAEACRLTNESVTMMRRLVELDPSSPDLPHDLCVSLNLAGGAARGDNRSEEARRLVAEGLGVAERVVASQPDCIEYQQTLARILVNLGNLALHEGWNTEARGLLERAHGVTQRLRELRPSRTDVMLDHAYALTNLGSAILVATTLAQSERMDRLTREVREEARQQAYRLSLESVRLTEQVAAKEPQRIDVMIDLAERLMHLGATSKDRRERREVTDRMIAILRPIRESAACEPRVDDLWTLANEARRKRGR